MSEPGFTGLGDYHDFSYIQNPDNHGNPINPGSDTFAFPLPIKRREKGAAGGKGEKPWIFATAIAAMTVAAMAVAEMKK